MTSVSVSLFNNKAIFNLPATEGKSKTYTVSSNSSRQQIIGLKVDDESPKELYFSGEGTRSDTLSLPKEAQNVVFTFSHEVHGEQKASQITSGGPYTIGETQLVIIVAENGDDADFNDAIVQLTIR